MKRIVPFLVLLVLVTASGITFLFPEEKPEDRKAADTRAAKAEVRYGNFWGPSPVGDVAYMLVDMRRNFEIMMRLWRKDIGNRVPFRCSRTADPAKSLFDLWTGVQLAVLDDHGWKAVSRSGDEYLLRKAGFREKEKVPPLLAEIFELDPESPYELPHPAPGSYLSLVLPYAVSLDAGREERYLNSEVDTLLMIPPYARSLRIYLGFPVDVNTVSFPRMPFLSVPKVAEKMYEVRYDLEALNVVRIDFKPYIPNFWKWREIMLKLNSLPGPPRPKNIPNSFAWEFLDENGDPLPADSPLPVAFFPQNFKEYFHPIPLKVRVEQ